MHRITHRNDDNDGNPGTMRMETKQLIPNGGVTGTGGGVSAPGTSMIPDNFFGFLMVTLGLR